MACLFLLGALAVVLPVPAEAQAPTPSVCDRTTQVRDVILSQVSGVTVCADVTTTHLAAITELSFSNVDGTGIRTLQSGDFAGLTGLELLSLHNNNSLASGRTLTLPADIFDGLTSLDVLDLGQNTIPTLPAGVFDELTALTDLSLSETFIESLPANVFDSLSNLANMSLTSKVDTLPAGIFDHLTKLTVLSLGSSNASFIGQSSLRSDLFDKLRTVTKIRLLSLRVSDILTA